MELAIEVERWPLREPFTIARGAKTEAAVVVITVDDDGAIGRGEAVPYPRYGETPDGVLAQLGQAIASLGGRATAKPLDASGADVAGAPPSSGRPTAVGVAAEVHWTIACDLRTLAAQLPPGAARNAVDLAAWDLEAKRTKRTVADTLGIAPRPVAIASTIPIRDAPTTAALAFALRDATLIKIKAGAPDDRERIEAVRRAAPDARLIVDVNEGWSFETLRLLAPRLADLGVELIEQPLPAADDPLLANYASPVPLCADESFVGDAARLDRLHGYAAVNVKLDKQGGLSEALRAVAGARARGLRVMIGSMVSTSLAVAPAVLLAHGAELADLDGPLFLRRDREPGLCFDRTTVQPPPSTLWG